LIPYRKYDLDLMAETLRHLHQEGLTPKQTKEAISLMGKNEAIELEDHQFHDFGGMFEQAFAKLNTTPQFKDLLHQQDSFPIYNPVGAVLDFGDHYQTPFPDQSRGQVSSTDSLPASVLQKLALDFFFFYQDGHYFLSSLSLRYPFSKAAFIPGRLNLIPTRSLFISSSTQKI